MKKKRAEIKKRLLYLGIVFVAILLLLVFVSDFILGKTTVFFTLKEAVKELIFSIQKSEVQLGPQIVNEANFTEDFINTNNIAVLNNSALDGNGNIIPTLIITGSKIVPDSDTKLLMHFENDASVGENTLIAYDWSGNGNKGDIFPNFNATYSTLNPVYDKYLHFSKPINNSGGGTGLIVKNMNASLDPSKGITISFWINNYNNVNTNGAIIFSFGKFSLRMYDLNGANLCFGNVCPYSLNNYLSGWNNFIITSSSTNWDVYINGIYKGAYGFGGITPYNLTGDFLVGQSSLTRANFSIDELAIWNRPLSSNEIADVVLGKSVVGNFESSFIQMPFQIFNLNLSLNYQGYTPNVKVTGNGSEWCDIGNGNVVGYYNCGLPSTNFKYKVNFIGNASINSIKFIGRDLKNSCLDADNDSYDNSDGSNIGCSDDEKVIDCNDNNRYLYPSNLNNFCDCDNSDGFSEGSAFESYFAGYCSDGRDNNCNGLIDYDDPDCAEDPKSWEDLNLKFTGISVSVNGSKFHDYMYERLWYDTKSDDDVVIYMKADDVSIKLRHNEDNIIGGGILAYTVPLVNFSNCFTSSNLCSESFKVLLKENVRKAKNYTYHFNISVINRGNTFDLVVDDITTPLEDERFIGLNLNTVSNIGSNSQLIDTINISKYFPSTQTQVIHSGDIIYRIDGDELMNDSAYDYTSYLGALNPPLDITSSTSKVFKAMFANSALQFFNYSKPFNMLPFLGKIGNNSKPYYDHNRISYGMIDSFGDEWHTITFWDNDWATNVYDPQRSDTATSDGKIIYIVLNPKTPVISFEAFQGEEYYTTPPKMFYVPYIFNQTTYLTSGVYISLNNVKDDQPIYYRVDNGLWIEYTGRIAASSLFSQNNRIYDFAFKIGQNGPVKIRVMHYNPAQPAQNEQHPKLEFKNITEVDKERFLVHGGSPIMTQNYQTLLNSIYKNTLDFRNGNRNLGFNYSHEGTSGGYLARYNVYSSAIQQAAYTGLMENDESLLKKAKEGLLVIYTIDPLGCESAKGRTGGPSVERCMYSGARAVPNIPVAYDLLFQFTKENGYQNGMTSIQHIKIRDNLAGEAAILLKYPLTWPDNFWTNIRYADASVRNVELESYYTLIGMAMPGYNSPYYGTSGADGTFANYLNAPFPDAAVAWTDLNFKGYVQNPRNASLFRDSFIAGTFDKDGSYLGPAREGYLLQMYNNLIPFMIYRNNFDSNHYERIENNLKLQILSRFPNNGCKMIDTYFSAWARYLNTLCVRAFMLEGYGGVSIDYLINPDFQDAGLYLWAKNNPVPVISSNEYLINPLIKEEPPKFSSFVGNNYAVFSKNLSDINTIFMRMKIFASDVPMTSGDLLPFVGNFDIVAYGERLAVSPSGSEDEPTQRFMSRQNSILIDGIDDLNIYQMRGKTDSSYLSPYLDYAVARTNLSLSGYGIVSYQTSSYRNKNVTLSRHVFFPDKRFFIFVDRLQSGTGIHNYTSYLHVATDGNTDADAFVINNTNKRIVWRKPSGVRLLSQFVSDIGLGNSTFIDYLYDNKTLQPYVYATMKGKDVQFVNLLYPLKATDSEPIINSIRTLDYEIFDIADSGGRFIFIARNVSRIGQISYSGIVSNADLTLVKINSSNAVEYYGIVNGSSLSYNTNNIKQEAVLGDYFGGSMVFNSCTNGIMDGDETGIDCGGSCNACGVIDITPPVISLVIESSITNQSAIVSWQTDEGANSRIYYGTTISLGLVVLDATLVQSHSVQLLNLLSNTTYYYKIGSCDIAGNCANSSLFNFRTLAGAFVDVEGPIVNLIAPANGNDLNSNSVTFSYTPIDFSSIGNCTLHIGVESRVDTAIENMIENSFTLTLSNGDYSWNVSCIDLLNNIGQSEMRTFKVNEQAPVVNTGGGSSSGGGGGSSAGSIKPKANSIINETLISEQGIDKISLQEEEVGFIDIGLLDSVVLDLYSILYEVRFEVSEAGVLLKVPNGDYLIPKDDVLPVLLGGQEMYVAVKRADANGAGIILGLNRELVREQLAEGIVEETGAAYIFIGIIIVIIGIVSLVSYIIYRRDKTKNIEPAKWVGK